MPSLDKNRTYLPKEALQIDGTVPVVMGKGRLSGAAKARIAELVEKGYRIAGYELEKTSNSVPAKKSKVKADKPVAKVKQVPITNEKVIADFVIIYDMTMYKAVGTDNKEWGMAEVCNNCRVSLVQCHCGNPVILGDIPVRIVSRG